jgi:hypothetical protein
MKSTHIARHSSCPDEVAGSHATPCRGVMSKLLVRRPVEVFKIARRQFIASLVPYIRYYVVSKDQCRT